MAREPLRFPLMLWKVTNGGRRLCFTFTLHHAGADFAVGVIQVFLTRSRARAMMRNITRALDTPRREGRRGRPTVRR